MSLKYFSANEYDFTSKTEQWRSDRW